MHMAYHFWYLLLVAGLPGLISTNKISASGSPNKSDDTPHNPVDVPKDSKMHLAYPFWSLVPVARLLGPNQ